MDIGQVFHPKSAEGQVEGGFQQGMGYALMEHLQFDQDTGACLSSDFLDYNIPTAMEMPSRIESIFVESHEPTGPFGAKSMSQEHVRIVFDRAGGGHIQRHLSRHRREDNGITHHAGEGPKGIGKL